MVPLSRGLSDPVSSSHSGRKITFPKEPHNDIAEFRASRRAKITPEQVGLPSYAIRALDRRPQQVGRRLGWRPRTVMAWAGLRGAVSLAAALALPQDFPERDLLIWLTLCVIFATRAPGSHAAFTHPRARDPA